MPGCCYADEYGDMFSPRAAGRTARRFERRGLRGTAKQLADGLAAGGLAGASVLEVGGGVGQVYAELLRRGAATAVNIELSPSWEAAATEMLEHLGLQERVERRVGDFVEVSGDLPDADVVVLHRVVCCYPDWRGMLVAATAKARSRVGLTLPVDRWASRAAVGVGNLLVRLQRRSFRAYVHPPGDIIDTLERAGFALSADTRGSAWRTLVAERAA
jgi:SAM-dependent methyltransferase